VWLPAPAAPSHAHLSLPGSECRPSSKCLKKLQHPHIVSVKRKSHLLDIPISGIDPRGNYRAPTQMIFSKFWIGQMALEMLNILRSWPQERDRLQMPHSILALSIHFLHQKHLLLQKLGLAHCHTDYPNLHSFFASFSSTPFHSFLYAIRNPFPAQNVTHPNTERDPEPRKKKLGMREEQDLMKQFQILFRKKNKNYIQFEHRGSGLSCRGCQ